MKKIVILSIIIISLCISFVNAITNPSTVTPINNSVWFNQPSQLVCSGSDGNITLFYSDLNGNTLLQVSSSTSYTLPTLSSPLIYEWSCRTCNGTQVFDNYFYYSFNTDDRNSTTVFNLVGNSSRDGLINGTSFVNGIIDTAINFDKKNEYLNMTNTIRVAEDYPFTINLWFYKTNNTPNDDLNLLRSNNAVANNFEIFIQHDAIGGQGKIAFITQKNAVNSYTVTSQEVLQTNQWYMVTARYNGSQNGMELYINGQLNNTGAYGNSGTTTQTNPEYWLGQGDVTEYINGTIDELGFWNRSLTQEEISELYNFGSGLAFTNITEQCSDLIPRTFTLMNFSLCSQTNSDVTLNFSHWNEEDLTQLNATTSLDLTLTNQYDDRSYNFNYINSHEQAICLSPSGIDVNLTGLIDYTPTNTSFTFARQYYFDDAEIYGGLNNQIKLYSLQDSLSSAVTFTISRDQNPVGDVYIWLQRYEPSTGTFNLVAIGQTNSNGQDVIYLRLTDAFYRILAVENGNIVYDSGTTHITSTSYPIQLSGTSGQISDYANIYNNLGNLNWNLTFNLTGSNNIALTVLDSSGLSTSSCLRVNKFSNQNGTQQLYYSCSSGTLITQTFQITDLTKNHFAEFIAFNNDVYRILDTLYISLAEKLSEHIGKEGLFYAFFIIVALTLLGALTGNSKVIVIFGLFGFIISYLLELINIGWTSAILIIVIGGIILVKIR